MVRISGYLMRSRIPRKNAEVLQGLGAFLLDDDLGFQTSTSFTDHMVLSQCGWSESITRAECKRQEKYARRPWGVQSVLRDMVWFQMCFVDGEAVDSCGEVQKTRAISKL